jgi:hypothetical protein
MRVIAIWLFALFALVVGFYASTNELGVLLRLTGYAGAFVASLWLVGYCLMRLRGEKL